MTARVIIVVSSVPSFSRARVRRELWMVVGSLSECWFMKAAWMCFSQTPSLMPSEQSMNWSPDW